MIIERPIEILLRRRAALGDVIMTTGVVRELKKLYNFKCNIDIVTDFPEVFSNNYWVRNMYMTSNPPDINLYDKYINLDNAYEYNPINHYLDSYFYRAFGSVSFDQSVELFENAQDHEVFNKFKADNQLEKYIVVHIRQWFWEVKNMSWETWYAVFEMLFAQRTDFKIVCIGSERDGFVEHPNFVDARGKLNIQQQALLINGARCFVGTDSAPFHIAASTDTHIISLHTHLRPERITPYRRGKTGWNTTPIIAQIPCVGCNDKQVRPVSQIECLCIPKDFRCKDKLTPSEIFNAIFEQLRDK